MAAKHKRKRRLIDQKQQVRFAIELSLYTMLFPLYRHNRGGGRLQRYLADRRGRGSHTPPAQGSSCFLQQPLVEGLPCYGSGRLR